MLFDLQTVFFGLVNGAGPFTGSGTVFFEGGYSPGNSPASVLHEGDLFFGGASTLTMELGGLLLGGQYDHLNVGGTLTEDGALDVVLYAGFAPHFGDTFDLFDAGSISGNFDDVNLPELTGDLTWDDSQLASTGTLRVVPEPGIGVLLASALALLGLRRRRSKKACHSERSSLRAKAGGNGVEEPLASCGRRRRGALCACVLHTAFARRKVRGFLRQPQDRLSTALRPSFRLRFAQQ